MTYGNLKNSDKKGPRNQFSGPDWWVKNIKYEEGFGNKSA